MDKRKTTAGQSNSKVTPMALESNLPTPSTAKQQIRSMLEITPLSYTELDNFHIIYPGMKDVTTLNAFRELRTKLNQKAGKNNFTVMISSLASDEGGTYISENLAAAIALDFEKTALLIDCNLSRKHPFQLAPQTVDYGIVQYLDDPTLGASDIIYASGIPRLRIIPSGAESTARSELLSSDRMEDLINEVKTRYQERYVILDAPPINGSPDARVLADLCDFTVLVVPYGKVTRIQVQAGINSIPGDKLAGLVFKN